jgi:hypothetical protein
MANQESRNFKSWISWEGRGFQFSIEIWRTKSDTSEKEFVVDVEYYPPFTLFKELRNYILNDQMDPKQRSSELGDDNKFLEAFNKISDLHLETSILIMDVANLRLAKPTLFWNLVYRFYSDRRDYTFLLPYELDIFPELYNEDVMEEYKMQVRECEEEYIEELLTNSRQNHWVDEEENSEQGANEDSEEEEKIVT